MREKSYVKLIDFGKATLLSDPVRYDIKAGSEKQRKYNTFHCHLAYELRNIPGSYESFATDVYTLGYNLNKVASHLVSNKLSVMAVSMMNKDASARPELTSVLFKLKRSLSS